MGHYLESEIIFHFILLNIQRKRTKVFPVLNYIIKHYAVKAHGNGGTAPPFLTAALDEGGGQLHAPVTLRPMMGSTVPIG
jgi:hypothetical protein